MKTAEEATKEFLQWVNEHPIYGAYSHADKTIMALSYQKGFTAGAESERAECDKKWIAKIKLESIRRRQLDL